MPRLREVARADAAPEVERMYARLFGDRDPTQEPGTDTGTPGNWWTVFALVPDIFNHALAGFGLVQGPARRLAPVLRELALVRAGFARQSQFVFSQHCKGARAAGVSDAKIDALPSWQTSELFSAAERAVLAYTDELVLQGGRVADKTFEALRAELSDEEILELTYTTCMYEMHATICRALRLEYDDVEERVVEVPAPGGAAQDVMAVVDE
jgi:alkylhydroperoxidase family enzyme